MVQAQGQGPSFAAISIFRDSSASIEHRIQAAKQLKNLIIGHDQRKELAVKNGIVQPLADVISSATEVTGKRKLPSTAVPLQTSHDWSPHDELRLQAALILGSLASGGPAFLKPLCAADIPKLLVEALSMETGPRLITAILQALKGLATFWTATEEPLVPEYDFWTALFNVGSLKAFDAFLRQATPGPAGRQHLKLAAETIALLPETGSTSAKTLITNCGLLDTLASLLAAHAVDHKIVWYRGDTSHLPPSPPQATLPALLAGVAAIISGSSYRAHRFILSPAVRDLFLNSGNDNADQRVQYGARAGFANSRQCLLPPLYIPNNRTVTQASASNAFPALKTMQASKPTEASYLVGDIDHLNAVCGWLLVLARSLREFNRLVALRLVALVNNAFYADPADTSRWADFGQKMKERQRQLALLAVPLAVELVQSANESKSSENMEQLKDLKAVKEQACSVLALLICGTKELQVAAVEACAIKRVCPLLKESFDNVSLAKPMWSAKSTAQSDANVAETCRIGSSVIPPEILHAMRCRKGALQALQALAAKEDLHRKAIIDAGVIGCIIDSLKPFPPDLGTDSHGRAQMTPRDGNTLQVILAACKAAQSMSRSVSVLRTSLIDGGIAKPLIALLDHPSLDVQVAATDVCCNLLPDFSPMREDLSDGKIVSLLVAHARSSSPTLRLSSLWALKHLVFSCPKELKIQTLEELGTGWLVGIIQGEQRESGSVPGGGVSIGLSSANAAGEQVDLLNPSSMDVDDPGTIEEAMDEDDEDGEVLYDQAAGTHYQSSQLRSTLTPPPPAFNSKRFLSSIRDMEQNDEYNLRKDEAAIQQQALDFLRNLVNGEDCAALCDHIMNQIGSDKLYELLTSKLVPVSRVGGRNVFHPTELVLSTIHVIIHLANASAKHRQMLVAQKDLLQAMIPHFNHVDHRVRVMNVWAVNSLTWIEEDGDRKDARGRSEALRQLGIEQAVKNLQNDPNLDVRERVKTAMRQFETL